ncbi:hypothetical protein CAEBREN_32850 [Caenorhabditis brenneri]|uniref:Piwi domain-containing protein n=1 Tax=Caenorhabditis brenneri TaxID=135651 RepID=G0NBB7_CAEBE|nr:hypothetical protein CAEBREN_32850 [Caenorhabditis brenneri]
MGPRHVRNGRLKRLSSYVIFKKWCQLNPDVFREKDTEFEIRIRSIGEVYTRGDKALDEKNRSELTRCVETISNQILHTERFFLFNSGTYPVQGGVLNKPDAVTEIKSGFSKVYRVVAAKSGQPKAVLTVDTASSPFFKATSVPKFVVSKLQSGGGRGGFGGRGGRGGDRERMSVMEIAVTIAVVAQRRNDGGLIIMDFDERAVKDMERDFKSGPGPICNNLKTIKAALKGLECYPLHLKGKQTNCAIIIDKIHDASAIKLCFTKDDEGNEPFQINIADYFKQVYCYTLKFPDLPVVGDCEFDLPIVVPRSGRTRKSQIGQQSNMAGRNSSLPKQHAVEARRVLDEYLKANSGNQYFKAFRLHLKSSSPIIMDAKILGPPNLKFHNKLNFMSKLYDQCSQQRFRMKKRWDVQTSHPDAFEDLRRYMELAKEKDIIIVIGIVEEKKPLMHDYMKYYEEKVGMQTIQITKDTARKFTQKGGGKQTIDNVLRKLNSTCGGTNFYVQIAGKHRNGNACTDARELYKKLYRQTQFIGFELSHTGARTRFDIQKDIYDGDPTSVGVGYSLRHASQLGGFIYFQDTRLHKLTRLDVKFRICLEGYLKADQRLPKQLVIYHIGSGEGDYAQIRGEVEEMREACLNFKAEYKPRFVVILVQRRSSIRVFPKRIEGNNSKAQNVPSGTCVDTVGNAHGLDEFVLCCQTPLIGIVRPTKYTILVNVSG